MRRLIVLLILSIFDAIAVCAACRAQLESVVLPATRCFVGASIYVEVRDYGHDPDFLAGFCPSAPSDGVFRALCQSAVVKRPTEATFICASIFVRAEHRVRAKIIWSSFTAGQKSRYVGFRDDVPTLKGGATLDRLQNGWPMAEIGHCYRNVYTRFVPNPAMNGIGCFRKSGEDVGSCCGIRLPASFYHSLPPSFISESREYGSRYGSRSRNSASYPSYKPIIAFVSLVSIIVGSVLWWFFLEKAGSIWCVLLGWFLLICGGSVLFFVLLWGIFISGTIL